MSHRNYRGNPEIYIQQCKTPKKPGSIQQYFPSNKGVCIQPNRGAIQTNKLSYGHRFTTTSKVLPQTKITNQYNSYPTYTNHTYSAPSPPSPPQNTFAIVEIPDEKYFACSSYDKLSIVNGNNIQISKTGVKNTFRISTTDNINILGDLTVDGDLKLTGIKTGSQDYVLYYNVDNNCVTYGTAPTGGGGVHDHLGDDSLGDYIHDNNFTIEGNLTVEQNFVVHGDASFCDVSACNIDISENLVVFGDASFCDVSACNIDITDDLEVGNDLTVKGKNVCFPGLDKKTAKFTLYYNDETGCITYDLSCCDIADTDFEVKGDLTVKGDTVLEQKLRVDGETTLNDKLFAQDDADVAKDLTVQGDAVLQQKLRVDGETTLNDKLVVDADASLCDVSACSLQVDGDASLCDVSACNLTVNENTWLGGDLQVLGNTSFVDANISSDLAVTGDTTLQDISASNIGITGDASFCDVSACNLQVDGDLKVKGDTVLEQKLRVDGETTLNAKLVVDADASLCDVSACNIQVDGDASLCDVSACNLQVDGSVCFPGLDQASTTHILYYDSTSGCITYDVSENGVINSDLTVRGGLTVEGDTVLEQKLRVDGETTLNDKLVVDADASLCDVSACSLQVDGDASLCDVSACNIQVDGDLEVLGKATLKTVEATQISITEDLTVQGHTQLNDVSMNDLVARDASFVDISACNIDISKNLYVGKHASLCDVSACLLELRSEPIVVNAGSDLVWSKNGNTLTDGNNNITFTALGIDPGDVLHIYCVKTELQVSQQYNYVVTVRTVLTDEITIANRFTDDPPTAGLGTLSDYTIVVNKQKFKITAATNPEDAFSIWRVDNFGDLHIIPSGTTGDSGAPCQDGGVSIWGQTEILRGADPTGLRAPGHAKLNITCYNSEATAVDELNGQVGLVPGEAILDMKASHDTEPCRIYFGNVGNNNILSGMPPSNCDASVGIGRIEYFNKAGHTTDKLNFSVSDGSDNPQKKLALSIKTAIHPADATIDICGNLNVSGDVCFTGIEENTAAHTLYYDENTGCITYGDISQGDPGAGDLLIQGDLTVNGTTTLNDKLVVDADASLCDVSACNLQVDGDASLCDVSACNLTVNENTWLVSANISSDLTVTGDTTLQDISAANIGITGDASFCDISACNIDAAGTVNISNTSGLPNKLVIENTGTQLQDDAPYDYDNTQNTNGYSYIKCLTGGLPAFQVDGDGSIKNRKSITITQEDAGWHNNQLRTTLGLTLIAKMQPSTQTTYPLDSLITTGYNTQVGGQVNETRKKLVGLALQASGESSSLDRGIVKVIPNFGSNSTEFQFDNSTNVLGNGGAWENTLWWTNNNDGTNQNSLYMSADYFNPTVGRPRFKFKSGADMILEWDPNTPPGTGAQIALGNSNTNIRLGSGQGFSPGTGTQVNCSYILCDDISSNCIRTDYIDNLRWNQMRIGQKSPYVHVKCSGTTPPNTSYGGIHLGDNANITCGDHSTTNLPTCTSTSGICTTRHKGTIGTFSSSSSCGTRLRGYSTITMTSIVSGIASKLCVIKNKAEAAGNNGFLACSSTEGPQATIIMRGKALLYMKDPGNSVNVDGWYSGKMLIDIDKAMLDGQSEGKLLTPHSIPLQTLSDGRVVGMPPGTFKKMFDASAATFMVTSGTIQTARGEEVAISDLPQQVIETSNLPWIEPFGMHAISSGSQTLEGGQSLAIAFDSPATGLYDSVMLFQGDQPNAGTRNIEVAVFEIVPNSNYKKMKMLAGSRSASWVGDDDNDGDWHNFSLTGLQANLVKNTRYYFVIRNYGTGAWYVATHDGAGHRGRRMLYKRPIEKSLETYLNEEIGLGDNMGGQSDGDTPYFRLYEETLNHPAGAGGFEVTTRTASTDYRWLYAKYVSRADQADANDFTNENLPAQFEIGARMKGFAAGGVGAGDTPIGLVVNYIITVPRKWWGKDDAPENFFADVPVDPDDLNGEYYWNPHKTTEQLNAEVGPWDNDGPRNPPDPPPHNHEEYASGWPQPGDSDYQKTYTQLNTCTGTDYETCGIATADPLGNGVNSAESGWTPLKDGPVGNPSHGNYTFTVDGEGRTLHNNFWEEDYKNGMWIQYELPQAETVCRYSFTMYHDDDKATAYGRAQYIQEYRGRLPRSFKLQGSDNSSDWTTLDTQTNVDWIPGDTITESQDRVFDITNSESYLFYRVVVDERGFSGQPHIRIVQIKLFRKRLPGDATLAAAGQQVAGPAQQVGGGDGNALVQPVQPEIL